MSVPVSSMRLHATRAVRFLTDSFSAAYPRGPTPGIEVAGVICLILTVFLMLWLREWSRAFEVLLVFTTLLSAGSIRREDPDAWIYLVLIGVVLWTLWVNHLAASTFPGWRIDGLESTRDCARMFLFALCGWWMGGRPRGIAVVVFAALAGIGATVASGLAGEPIARWASIHGGAFGFHNSQHTAIVIGTMLLGLLAFGWRLCRPRGGSRGVRLPRILAWITVSLICLYVIRMTGNRQVWLGLAGAAAAAIWLFWLAARRSQGQSSPGGRYGRLVMAGIVIAGLTGTGLVADRAWQKLEREWTGVSSYLAGDTESAEINSATIRLMLWHHVLAAAAERPLLGYGGNSSARIIENSDLPQSVREHYGHPHNSYLQLWISYGIAMPLLFIAMLVGLALRVYQAWKHSFLANDTTAFLLGWLTFYAVVNGFESYVFYDSGVFLTMVVGGMAYSATLPCRRYLSNQRTGRRPTCPG